MTDDKYIKNKEKKYFYKNPSEYKMDYGIICIVDALGTKGIWGQISPKSYIDKLDFLENLLNEKIDELKRNTPEKIDIKIMSFSDTFFITFQFPEGSDDENHGYSVYLLTFSQLIADFFYASLVNYIYFRGAISHGYFLNEKNKIVGPAVDDAASYFERANFIGVICTPSAGYAYESSVPFARDIENYFIKYPVPLKNPESKKELIVLDWPKLFLERYNNLKILTRSPEEALKSCLSKYPIPDSTTDKYLNTLDFFNFSIKKITPDSVEK